MTNAMDRFVLLRLAREAITAYVHHQPMPLIELEGVTTREAADPLRGAELEIARDDLEMGEGEYLVADLVGCEAVDSSGRTLGQVQSILFNGAQDVLVISDDLMIPLVDEWIVAVDLEARRITVEPPDAV